MKQPLYFISFLVAIILLCAHRASAQNNDWREYLQQLEEEGASSDQVGSMYEELSDIEANPFNLNSVSLEDLRQLPFLTEEQRQSMVDFFSKNRPIYSVYELRNIPLLNVEMVEMVLPFFYAGEYVTEVPKFSLMDLLKNSRQEIQLRLDKVYPRRAGYKAIADSILQRYPNRKYLGEDFYHSIKYAFSAGKKLQAGVVVEKDAGEPFWNSVHKGYDHYGGYLTLKDWGNLKALVLGDFRLSFGQGLVLNNNFSLGKTSATTAVARRTSIPTRHASTAESGFFRGAAATYQIADFRLTMFYSYRKVDGNISSDNVITSFKADGYHRVPLERSKKGNVVEQVAGSNLQLVKNRWQAGVSFIYSKFDRQYQPAFQEYNRFYLRGNSNWNGSIDYTYRFRKFSFVGESAMSQNGSMATLNTLNFYPRQGVALTVLQRQYSRSYQAQYANAFSDGSNVQNESGWYVGSQFSPSGKLSISLYADAASFPWLKYGVNSPSKSFDYLVQSNYRYDPSLAVEVRYRFRQKEDNFKYPDEKTTSILEYDQHKLLVQAMKTLSHGWSTHTTLDWNAYKPEHLSPEYGWMISQLVSWQSPKRWKTDFFAGYFDADSYSVRVYSRERNIVNSFYMPSFYGKGMRLALSGKYGIRPGLSLAVKGAISNYFDRETIGSDLEKIDSRRRIDMMTYLKWSF